MKFYSYDESNKYNYAVVVDNKRSLRKNISGDLHPDREVSDKYDLSGEVYYCKAFLETRDGEYKEAYFWGIEPYYVGSSLKIYESWTPNGNIQRACKQEESSLYEKLDNLERIFNFVCDGTNGKGFLDAYMDRPKENVLRGKFSGDKKKKDIDFSRVVECRDAVKVLETMEDSIFESCPVVPDPARLARMTGDQSYDLNSFGILVDKIGNKIKKEIGPYLLAAVDMEGKDKDKIEYDWGKGYYRQSDEAYQALELRAKRLSEEMSEREGKEVNVSPEEALEIIGAKCKWYLIDTFEKELKPALERCKEVFPDLLPGGKEPEIAEDKGVVKAEEAPEAGL